MWLPTLSLTGVLGSVGASAQQSSQHPSEASNDAVVLAEQREAAEGPEEVACDRCLFFHPPRAFASCTFRFDSALHHSQYKSPISHSSHALHAHFFLTSV